MRCSFLELFLNGMIKSGVPFNCGVDWANDTCCIVVKIFDKYFEMQIGEILP